MTEAPPLILRPQPGPQERFLSTPADLAIYGGAAGGGKTFALLLEAARHARTKGYTGMIFRRTYREIMEPGGLWDFSQEVYRPLGGRPRESDLSWEFGEDGGTVKFGHLQHEKHRFTYQGSQLAFIGFDELTHFTYLLFWYMFSRNRSTCGVRPYIRCTTNPDADHWLRGFIDWWIDEKTGQAIPERSGALRYMARQEDQIIWADTAEELTAKGMRPRSVTFVSAKLEDNPALTNADPDYRSNLLALPRYERKQLLDGDWNSRPAAGEVFQRDWFKITEEAPAPVDVDGHPLWKDCRYWDRAATEPNPSNTNPDWTRGVKIRDLGGHFVVLDVASIRGTPGKVKRLIKNTASQDGLDCHQVLAQDPGSAGKAEVADLVKMLSGHIVKVVPETKAKVTRAGPASSAAEYGNIDILRAPWNDAYLDELEAFPTPGVHDDQADGTSGAINYHKSRREVSAQWL